MTRSVPRALVMLTTAVATAVLASCSVVGATSDDADPAPSGTSSDGSGGGTVVLVTHDSFSLPKQLIQRFETTSGYQLKVQSVGDAGTLTNQLVLTKDDPLGDVAFGVDNTFGSRAIQNGVFASYDGERPDGVDAFDLPGDTDHDLTPVDNGNVCVNVDDAWFAAHHQAPPTTLDDLTDPAYKDLTVTPAATTSSTGLAFLLGTIAAKGDGWQDYWNALLSNGLEITKGWEDAYDVDFTYSGGDRPIVVSYDSSPAFTVKDGASSTSALLDTCFRQIEYVGVLNGAKNVPGAQALVDFLLTPAVQAALPDSMYVFPVVSGTKLPTQWARFAQRPTQPFAVDPADVDAQRETWLREWSDLTSR